MAAQKRFHGRVSPHWFKSLVGLILRVKLPKKKIYTLTKKEIVTGWRRINDVTFRCQSSQQKQKIKKHLYMYLTIEENRWRFTGGGGCLTSPPSLSFHFELLKYFVFTENRNFVSERKREISACGRLGIRKKKTLLFRLHKNLTISRAGSLASSRVGWNDCTDAGATGQTEITATCLTCVVVDVVGSRKNTLSLSLGSCSIDFSRFRSLTANNGRPL